MDIEDDLLHELRKEAAEAGDTLQAVVNRRLRRGATAVRSGGFRLRLPTFGSELRPGVDLDDRDALYRVLEDGDPAPP